MRRAAVVSLALLALTAVAVSAAQPRAQLRAFVCKRAPEPRGRSVSITAVMRPRPGTQRMELKFELLERPAGGASTSVTGGDLGTWLTPGNATLGSRGGDVWILKHPVKDLAGPAHYRFRVSFRWIGAHRRVLGTVVRLSATCYQPDHRADLAVTSIKVQPATAQSTSQRYDVTIRNDGGTDAPRFQVWFTAGSVTIKDPEPGLRRHGTLKESFLGSRCLRAKPPVVTADPTHEVNDSNRANNSLQAKC